MAPRASLPGELFLDAIVIYPERQLAAEDGGNDNDYGRRIPYDEAARERAARRQPYIALRWVLNPALGIPLGPFTVWRRPAGQREAAVPINGWHQAGFDTFEWDGVTEMLRIEVDLTAAATITGLHRNDLDPVLVSIGPLAIRWYALAYIFGILLGWVYARAIIKRPALWGGKAPLTVLDFDDFILWVTFGVIVGGRLGNVLFYDPAYYAENPLEIVMQLTRDFPDQAQRDILL